jgi:hypothetical protein
MSHLENALNWLAARDGRIRFSRARKGETLVDVEASARDYYGNLDPCESTSGRAPVRDGRAATAIVIAMNHARESEDEYRRRKKPSYTGENS